MARIVIIEDEEGVAHRARRELVEALGERWSVEHCPTLRRGRRALAERTELALIDILLEDGDGRSLLAELKGGRYASTPRVIMMSAQSPERCMDGVFQARADDYLVKPWRDGELAARVRWVLGLSASPPAVQVDEARHEARIDGEVVALTRKEFSLLSELTRRRGEVVGFARLIAASGGRRGPEMFDCEKKALDVHVCSLRKKMGGRGALIESARGAGFRLAEES